jgi:hypothetical protein
MTMMRPAAATEQDAAAAYRLLEHKGARLRRDLGRDLAHRRQQRGVGRAHR